MDDFDPLRAEKALRDLANAAPVIPVSARRAINLERWHAWLRARGRKVRSSAGNVGKPQRGITMTTHHPAVA